MGFQVYYCKFCKHQFYWCSVGGFSSGGEHDKKCKVLKKNFKGDWSVPEDYIKLISKSKKKS